MNMNYQIPNTNPESAKRMMYIPASIARSFNERLANRYVAVIGGRTHTNQISIPACNPSFHPELEATALNPAGARKCITPVPPKISG